MRQRDSIDMIRQRKPFKCSNFYGLWVDDPGDHAMYVVYSYGYHWPLAIWTAPTAWIRNIRNYGKRTTGVHADYVRRALDPAIVGPVAMSRTNDMCAMVDGDIPPEFILPEDKRRPEIRTVVPPTAFRIEPAVLTRKQFDLFDIST